LEEERGLCRAVGYLDDDPHLQGAVRLGLPVLGSIGNLAEVEHEGVVIAIGDNGTRARIFTELASRGERLFTACHPDARLGMEVSVGAGTMICAGVVINAASSVGANVIVNTGCTIDHHNVIGDHAHLAPGVHTGGDVQVGEGCLVGIGSTILPGVRVGSWSIIGAGSVVTKIIPERVLALGAPARVVRELQWEEVNS
jgi:sugar O-acyltransferase (sialic acid O-acetyltransferase NeuD family)